MVFGYPCPGLVMPFMSNLLLSQDIHEECGHHVWFDCCLLLVKEEMPTDVPHSTISLLFLNLKL